MSELLHDLVVEVESDIIPERNQKCFSIETAKRDLSGVQIYELEKKGLLKSLFARDDGKRFILVHTGRSIEQADLVVDCEDVGSEVAFRIVLKLDLETPTDETSLRHMINAFRDATFTQRGARSRDAGNSSITKMFERELTQWLRSKYQKKTELPDLRRAEWAKEQARKVAIHITSEYGLTAQAKFIVYPTSDVDIDAESIKVEASAKDSAKPVSIGVRVGCRLKKEVSAFEAPTLKPAQFTKLVRDVTADFISDELTLQQFRFDTTWDTRLKKKLEAALAAQKRDIVGYHLEMSGSFGGYERGPHHARSAEARFVPLGWETNMAINFASTAVFNVIDAAKFEKRFDGMNLHHAQEHLSAWLAESLQEAVDSCLHDIHRSDQGYAELLTRWEDRYKSAIQDYVSDRAKEIGVDGSTIVATPDRAEMELVGKGAEISTGPLKLESLVPRAKLEFEADFKVSAENFENIRDILNKTDEPLDHIRDNIVLKALERAARKLGYIDFNLYFEIDRPAKGETEAIPSAVAQMHTAVDEALSLEGLKLDKFEPHRVETEDWMILDRLISAPARRVEFETRRLEYRIGDNETALSDPFIVSFDLKISGLNEPFVSFFFENDWAQEKGDFASEYDAVHDKVQDRMVTSFTNESFDILTFAGFEEHGYNDEMKKLVLEKLDAYLGESFGLSGRAIAISVGNIADKIEADTRKAGLLAKSERDVKRIEFTKDKQIKEMEIEAKADVKRAERRAEKPVTDPLMLDDVPDNLLLDLDDMKPATSTRRGPPPRRSAAPKNEKPEESGEEPS